MVPWRYIFPIDDPNFRFPIINFHWLIDYVPRLLSYGIYIWQLIWFAMCCTNVFDFHSKNLQFTSKLLTFDTGLHRASKTFEQFFRSYSDLLSKFNDISFQDHVSEEISHPVYYGDLVHKVRKIKCAVNFVSSGSKIVKCLRRWMYSPVIIERIIGLVLCPSIWIVQMRLWAIHYD